MRGIAFAFAALTLVAATPLPASAQCYGPECDRQRSAPPARYDERTNFHTNPAGGGQYRQAPFGQQQQYQQVPYSQPTYQQPSYQQPPYQQSPYQQPGFQQPAYQQPGYQQPGYQPRPPAGYANVPPGMSPHMSPRMAPGPGPQGHNYRPAPPGGRIATPPVTLPKAARHAAYPHTPAPSGRKAVRQAAPTAGAGQITISVAEYRDLQNQARELQRLMTTRSGAPNPGAGFPDAPFPPPPGQPAGR